MMVGNANLPDQGEAAVLMGFGRWFDGRSSAVRLVNWQLRAQTLFLYGEGQVHSEPTSYACSELKFSERLLADSWPLALPDGGSLWITQGAKELQTSLSPAHGVELTLRSWPRVIACLLLMLASLLWFDRIGAGFLAEGLLTALPRNVDIRVGDRVAPLIVKELAATRLPKERTEALSERFYAAAASHRPDLLPLRLDFYRGKRGQGKNSEPGFNAFALPNGQIVVLDGLAEALTDDELMVVLGHELGHIEHRHGMRRVLRSFGLLASAGVVFGDLSSVMVTGMASVQELGHSREDEREADAFGLDFARRLGLDAGVASSVWRKFDAYEKSHGLAGMPAWLSTHPPTPEREQAARVQH